MQILTNVKYACHGSRKMFTEQISAHSMQSASLVFDEPGESPFLKETVIIFLADQTITGSKSCGEKKAILIMNGCV